MYILNLYILGSCTGCDVKHNGACYKIETTRRNHASSEAFCSNWKQGGHLAWFDDEAEHNHVMTQVKTRPVTSVYIGKNQVSHQKGSHVSSTG